MILETYELIFHFINDPNIRQVFGDRNYNCVQKWMLIIIGSESYEHIFGHYKSSMITNGVTKTLINNQVTNLCYVYVNKFFM